MLNVAPESLARSVAWRTASEAVSEPSVPTTIRLNTAPPLLGRRWTALILTPLVGLGGDSAEPVAEDFGRGRREAIDRDRHRGEQRDDEHDHPDFPQQRHRRQPSREPAPR